MYYKRFKELDISALGLGVMRLPLEKPGSNRIDRLEGQKIIDAAMDSGINYFDTAHMYNDGDSERFLGEALAGYPRDSYYLATKFNVSVASDIRSVFKEQLRRCRTGYFDFYLLHDMNEKSISAYMDDKKNYLGYLLEQKKAGFIRHLGFSSHAAPPTLAKFLQWHSAFDMALIQLNYLDWTVLEAKSQYEILTQYGIPVWVMEPLKGGRLSQLNDQADDLLKSAAPERSISSWAFRFLMGLANVQTVLSGMSTIEQIHENAKTFDGPAPLNEQERQVLQRSASAFMKDLGIPCSSCRYCCATCPAELDIPLLIKGYNEGNISGETWRVAGLALRSRGADECIQCGVCLEHCPQKIDIPEIMRKIAESQ